MDFDARNVAEAFPPGEFIKEELDMRGWTQEELADLMEQPRSVISNIVTGKRSISPDIASGLADVFGTTSQLWMNLESSYQLFLYGSSQGSRARKARLYEKAPIKDMIKRGWIKASSDLDVLEQSLLEFLEIGSLDEQPKMRYAAKRSTQDANPSQVVWVYRAKKLARTIDADRFSDQAFENAMARLKRLRQNPEEVRSIPRVLAKGGVRLVLIEGLRHGRIDGVCFWLDEKSPVIAISMRFDRLDHLWYVVGHECGHVKNHDALDEPILDVNLVGEDAIPFEEKSDVEKRADTFAEGFLVEPREMEFFIARVRPLYSKQKIKNFAARIGVHPAIVLGQLQHRKEVDWSHSREMLVKARGTLMTGTLTDGWGSTLPPNI
jgi:HTH-type transcriptional regulator / antitoxin HigA